MKLLDIKACSLGNSSIYSLFSGEEYNNPIATQDFYLDIATMSLGDLELEEFFFFRIRSRGVSDGCQQIVLQQLFRQPNEIVTHLPSGCCVILCNSSRSPRSVWLVPVFLENTTRDVPDSIGNQSRTSPTARRLIALHFGGVVGFSLLSSFLFSFWRASCQCGCLNLQIIKK